MFRRRLKVPKVQVMASSTLSAADMKKLKKTLFSRIVLLFVCLGLLVLLPAGTFNFWQFYAYTATLVMPMLVVLFYFLRKKPEFLVLRMKLREKEKRQTHVVIVSSVAFILGFVVSGLDHRFGWSAVPTWTAIGADLVVVCSYLLVIWVFKVNSYASRVIEVQEKQSVISIGPYSVVRHPMYLGVLIMYFATPIALGSFWGIIPFLVLPYALILRIFGEEKLLSEQLEGYKAYCEKVRYRLIPFIW